MVVGATAADKLPRYMHNCPNVETPQNSAKGSNIHTIGWYNSRSDEPEFILGKY